jgi:hypothetical protein
LISLADHDMTAAKRFDSLFARVEIVGHPDQIPDDQQWKKLNFFPDSFLKTYKVSQFVWNLLLTEAIRE